MCLACLISQKWTTFHLSHIEWINCRTWLVHIKYLFVAENVFSFDTGPTSMANATPLIRTHTQKKTWLWFRFQEYDIRVNLWASLCLKERIRRTKSVNNADAIAVAETFIPILCYQAHNKTCSCIIIIIFVVHTWSLLRNCDFFSFSFPLPSLSLSLFLFFLSFSLSLVACTVCYLQTDKFSNTINQWRWLWLCQCTFCQAYVYGNNIVMFNFRAIVCFYFIVSCCVRIWSKLSKFDSLFPHLGMNAFKSCIISNGSVSISRSRNIQQWSLKNALMKKAKAKKKNETKRKFNWIKSNLRGIAFALNIASNVKRRIECMQIKKKKTLNFQNMCDFVYVKLRTVQT